MANEAAARLRYTKRRFRSDFLNAIGSSGQPERLDRHHLSPLLRPRVNTGSTFTKKTGAHTLTEAKQVQKARTMKAVSKPARRSQAERRQDSQARIMDAAMKLLVERGYDRFSLQDVGRLTGCSHELINHYYGN